MDIKILTAPATAQKSQRKNFGKFHYPPANQAKNSAMSKVILGYNQKKLKYAALIDGLLNCVLSPFKTNKKLPSISSPGKILVLQSHLIGDVVMATPVLKALRKAYPDSHISLLANEFAKDLLQDSGFIDRIITTKFPWSTYDYSPKNLWNILKLIKHLRKEKFDLAIDAQIDFRNTFLMYLTGTDRRLGYGITGGSVFLTDTPKFPHDAVSLLQTRLSLLSYLGIDTSDKTAELPIGKENIQWLDSYLQQNNLDKNKIVAIHPAASTKEKLWQSEKFAAVIDFLISTGYQPVVIEGPKDEGIVTAVVSLCKIPPPTLKTSLKNVVAFISRCRLIICLDSAAIHLAGAVGTPVVALYGPKWPELTKPFRNNIEIVWNESFNCRPCEYGHCKNIGHSCMDAISSDIVIQKADKVLSKH